MDRQTNATHRNLRCLWLEYFIPNAKHLSYTIFVSIVLAGYPVKYVKYV